MQEIDPKRYAATRNYQNGKLTHLSPYISRGVISTKNVFDFLKTKNVSWESSEKLIQELAWRDYWQVVWKHKGQAIFEDLKYQQQPVSNSGIPDAILYATTEINEIDTGIQLLYNTGYMHNHMRMYVASICTNIAQSHWLEPAKWLYYYLLDGDLASNMLSWQWVSGSNSNKKYYANQDNIDKYFFSNQKGTFLDVSYEDIPTQPIPEILKKTSPFSLKTDLPKLEKPILEKNNKTLVFNYYNVDPYWQKNAEAQRLFLLEPSFFKKYPVSKSCIDFVINLSKNIEGIKIFIGEFSELLEYVPSENIYYKEHPTNSHYSGSVDSRDWMTNETSYYPSFYKFWNACKKDLQSQWNSY